MLFKSIISFLDFLAITRDLIPTTTTSSSTQVPSTIPSVSPSPSPTEEDDGTDGMYNCVSCLSVYVFMRVAMCVCVCD